MAKYIFKRIMYMLVVLFVVTTITFFLIHSIPGNPILSMVQDLPMDSVQTMMEKYGYDQPVYVQYFKFLGQLFRGNLGDSIRYPGRSIWSIVAKCAPISAVIGGWGLLLGFVIGVLLGIVGALNRNKAVDKIIIILALLGTSLPAFVIASMLQYTFGVKLKVLPITGWKSWKYAILPVACMFVSPLASYTRYMRSSMLDILSQDYILLAEAKGVSKAGIVTKHMLRNAFLPCITMLGVNVANIFSGSFIIESIFAVPGIGKYFISAINDRDYSMVLGLNLIFTGIYILSILITDILLCILDPRIRMAEEQKVNMKRKIRLSRKEAKTERGEIL